jgi:hypothetical protein
MQSHTKEYNPEVNWKVESLDELIEKINRRNYNLSN